jgi:asparagine synthase (glutamine-hydrolysing)
MSGNWLSPTASSTPVSGAEKVTVAGAPAASALGSQASSAHGLLGWYASDSDSDVSRRIPTLTEGSIVTDARTSLLERDRGAGCATGSVCAFGKQGIAVVAGTPVWKTRELAETAASEGDAAALVAAYNIHGRKLVDQLSGPFSFAVLDGDGNRFLAGIDRLGQHTLYHALHEGRLLYGSTATAVLAQIDTPPTLLEQGIYNYFYFHMVPSPQSVYRGVGKLPAAHCLELRDGNIDIFRYWSPAFSRKANRPMAAAGEELQTRLRDAVEKSLEGTVSVGTFLSGGLDSSTVTGMLAELTDRTRPAYAIGFDEDGYDEMEYARATARHFGVTLREYYVTPEDVLAELPTIANSYDEPFGNSSALPAYFCAQRAREDGIDCLLAGDGGDEIFAGNSRYAKQQVFKPYSRVPAIVRNALLEPGLRLLPNGFPLTCKATSYIRQAKVPLPDRLQSYNYLNRMGPSDIFSETFLAAVDTEAPLELQRRTYNSLENASDLSRMLYLDWQYTLADNDLRKVSRMCAVAGVGVRYPMLDDELVAFSCKLPDKWKLRRGDLRHFFKESLRGWLPDATINKKKQGFGLPFGLWMQRYKPLNELANDCLLRLGRRGYFQPGFLDRLIDLHRQEHAAYYGEFIWILTIFDLWLESRGSQQAEN